MKRQGLRILAAAGCMIALAGTAQAQVFTPTLQSPRLVNEMSIYVGDGPGDLAIGGIWRGGPLGLRLGYVDGWGGLLSVGAELRNPIPVANAPLGLAFTASGEALVGDETGLGFQAGLSAGYTFHSTGLAFTPYLHPRAALVRRPGIRNEDLRFEVLADVGGDIEFHNNILVHFGIRLDNNVGSNFGIGIGVRR
jgi:hypothetical protein